jgi:hypothetical protein
MNRERLLLAAGCAAFLAAIAAAQPASAPQDPAFAVPPYKNLQVLSKDITRDQLLSNMKFFAQSLGVRCSHCHVGVEGQPLSTFDFASDAKREKNVARSMLTMVHKINSEEFGVKDFSQVKATCYTCHRGALRPLTAPPHAPVPQTPSTTERGSS